jgi:MtN3 and saliva related transmembrane protein
MIGVFILGLASSILVTLAYVPQTVHTIRTKHTKGLSRSWLIIMIAGSLLYAAYGIMLPSIPIIISSVAIAAMAIIILYHKFRYG